MRALFPLIALTCLIPPPTIQATPPISPTTKTDTTWEEWPQWRGPRGDGTWNGPPLKTNWPKSGLKKLWAHDLGGGYGGISVAHQKVYVMDRPAVSAEDQQNASGIHSHRVKRQNIERILCFDALTGKKIWAREYPCDYKDLDYGNGPRAAPTIVEEVVYTLGTMGDVRCLSAKTGDVIWKKQLVTDFGGKVPQWGYAAAPYVIGDLVILLPGGKEQGTAIVALDRKTGTERWRSLSDTAGYATPLLIQHQGQNQLIVWSPNHIHSIDPNTGQHFWSVPYKITYGVAIANPIAHEGLVFVAGYWDGSKAIQLGSQPEQADLKWEDRRNLRGLMSQPLYRDGYAYLLDKKFGLTCFEFATGKKIWDDDNRMTPGNTRNPQATMVWLKHQEPRALILNSEGDLILAELTPAGYRELTRTNLIGETWAHPAYAENRIFLRSNTQIIAYELPVAEPIDESP
ncbi:outer membrane protein assembly factor BamB family protein [Gimesia panareensis]|uniref:outer membrane protein assembly factor BamB family protein n=1 Tax=Gimesia panareensis TaxID=2527978 RepID=UPI00118D0AFB|nr:PQQ-binding-like beta-propeller repeat protein [Gimesia panareensis]QDU50418.1 outer membrane biogenesis protein BamB [Gimesia panareensis]